MNQNGVRVCFFSINAYPLFNSNCQANFGGAEVQLYQLANKLAEDGNFLVSFFVADEGQGMIEWYGRVRVIKAYPLNDKKNGLFERIYRKIYTKIIFLFKLAFINPDVCIHRAAGIETGILAFYCKVFRKKFIYMTASESDCNGDYEKKSGFAGKCYAYGLKNADLVITQNGEHQKMLQDIYGIDSIIIRSSYDISDPGRFDKKGVLWVARLIGLKQPEKYFALAGRFPEEKFVLIGPKSDDIGYAENIQRKMGAFRNIEYIPRVPFSEIGRYFEEAKILVNTSEFEGFPNTFVQAAMAGTPIVSLNVNPDNFLDEWRCGYCARGDFEKMVWQTEKLLSDDKDWQDRSENAFVYAKANHDIENNILKMKDEIGRLLGK